MNIKFNYLYRDESNYKDWGSVIFRNANIINLPEAEKEVRKYLDGEEFFVACKIDIPDLELYLSDSPSWNKYWFHEFDCLELTDELPTDSKNRSFNDSKKK